MRKWIILIIIVLFLAGLGEAAFLSSKNRLAQDIKAAPVVADLLTPTPVAAPVPLPLIAAREIMESQPSSSLVQTENTQKPICENAPDQFDCWEEFYTIMVKTKGVKVAVANLKERYEENDYAQAQCHPIMHVIGHTAVGATTKVAEAFQKGDPFCWSGYYHGVMEGVAGRIGRTKLAGQMDSICAGIPGKASYSFDYYNCVHGMGHGVMAILNDELFESLELCNSLTGSWEQSSCWSGAFMENVIVDNKNHFTKYLKPEEPLYPCNAVADKYKTTCYLMQTSYMLKVTGEDFPKVFALCKQAGKDEYVNVCHQSLGRDASGHTVSDIPRTRDYCLMGPDFRAESNCVIGAVKDFISYHHSDKQAYALCAALPAELQPICRTTAAEYYKSF